MYQNNGAAWLEFSGNRRQIAARGLPAWPITWLFIGLPLWWLIGLYPLSPVIMSVPMMYLMMTRIPRIVILPGVMPYIGFVVWLIPCAAVLGGFGDILGFSMRFVQFAAVAVIIIYVINSKDALTHRMILNCIAMVYFWIVLGGYLGMLLPEGSLEWTVGKLLPASLSSNEYIFQLFTPPFAEIQKPWGVDEPFYRPSAPFLYANGWGAAVGILIPALIGVALERRSFKAFVALPLALLAAVPPMIQATNRGLLLAIIAAVAYILVRLLFRGKIIVFLVTVVVGIAAGLALIGAGMMDGINERQDAVDTTAGRSDLYVETWHRTLESPLFGYGSPQPSYTSEIFVGTQGMIWSLMFCYGLIGLALFMVFLVASILRTWSAPTSAALWIHSSIIAATIMSIFYGLDRHLPVVGLMIALMLRERYSSTSAFWSGPAVKSNSANAPRALGRHR